MTKEMGDHQEGLEQAARTATINMANALGLKVLDGRHLRVAREPNSHADTASDVAECRFRTAKAWARAMAIADDEFGVGLTGTAVWPLLLDLYIHRAEGKPVSISSACLAMRIPATTGLRWIAVLEGRGYIYRLQDPKDGRRVYLQITSLGLEKLERALDAVAESDAKLGLGRLILS